MTSMSHLKRRLPIDAWDYRPGLDAKLKKFLEEIQNDPQVNIYAIEPGNYDIYVKNLIEKLEKEHTMDEWLVQYCQGEKPLTITHIDELLPFLKTTLLVKNQDIRLSLVNALNKYLKEVKESKKVIYYYKNNNNKDTNSAPLLKSQVDSEKEVQKKKPEYNNTTNKIDWSKLPSSYYPHTLYHQYLWVLRDYSLRSDIAFQCLMKEIQGLNYIGFEDGMTEIKTLIGNAQEQYLNNKSVNIENIDKAIEILEKFLLGLLDKK